MQILLMEQIHYIKYMHVLISKVKKQSKIFFFIKRDNHSTDINQVLYQIFFLSLFMLKLLPLTLLQLLQIHNFFLMNEMILKQL